MMLLQLAGQSQAALILENLKGLKLSVSLRKASKRMRQRLLNHWSIIAFHRILAIKAREYGVPLKFISPKDTSKTCPISGDYLRGQDKKCPSCGLSRHYVAAINIARKGMEKFPNLTGVLPTERLGQGLIDSPHCLSSGSNGWQEDGS